MTKKIGCELCFNSGVVPRFNYGNDYSAKLCTCTKERIRSLEALVKRYIKLLLAAE